MQANRATELGVFSLYVEDLVSVGVLLYLLHTENKQAFCYLCEDVPDTL